MAEKYNNYHSVLVVSASEKFDQIIKKSVNGHATVDIKKSGSLARRSILERYYDIIVINAPLSDETGEDIALEAAEKLSASVLLVTPNDVMDEVISKVSDAGVLVVGKPSPVGRIDKAVRFIMAIQNKIHERDKKLATMEEKLEEMRIVGRVKCMLIEKKGISEEEAHRYIGKLAMDNGISRAAAARKILDD
ncbi:MAG: ANTAR domain-containing protein [Lachnospiraceae bacterium]|nr:ANTAR domain-containing protein [Lachnospiraceae bacterium]